MRPYVNKIVVSHASKSLLDFFLFFIIMISHSFGSAKEPCQTAAASLRLLVMILKGLFKKLHFERRFKCSVSMQEKMRSSIYMKSCWDFVHAGNSRE